jgi:hypothetical protein
MDVYVARGDLTRPLDLRPVTRSDATEVPSGFASDGSVLFHANREGPFQIYSQRPGELARKLTHDPAAKAHAFSAPDGSLLYWRACEGGYELVHRGAPVLRVSEPPAVGGRPGPMRSQVQCGARDCLFGQLEADRFRYARFDVESGARAPEREVRLAAAGGRAWCLARAADRVAIPSNGPALEVVRLDDGQVDPLPFPDACSAQSCAWSADGTRLVVTGLCRDTPAYRIWSVSAAGAEELWQSAHEWPWSVALSPDGAALAVGIKPIDSDPWLYEPTRP